MGTWMIRAGRGGVYAKSWLEAGMVGIGWDFNNTDIATVGHKRLRQIYSDTHPDYNAGKVALAASQAAKFAHDMTAGTVVVTYDPEDRVYHIGKITGDCTLATEIDGITYKRNVQWEHTAPRDMLATSSRNSLGSLTTIFRIADDVVSDLMKAADVPANQIIASDPIADTDDDEARLATYDDGIERIKDRLLSLDWEDMERLVAGLLKAMGYCARVKPKGPDGGRDVIASPDALGLESPRIIAEVKHRKGAMGAPAVRSFIGGLRADDRGLYVSTGGFTKEARYEADRANIPIRLLDLDSFVRLYVETYDKADEETRAILPLVRIWWPA